VRELERAYAAGDATDFAIKLGGIAAQQADTAAQAIAALAGAPVEPKPFHAEIQAILLGADKPLYLSAHVTGDHGSGARTDFLGVDRATFVATSDPDAGAAAARQTIRVVIVQPRCVPDIMPRHPDRGANDAERAGLCPPGVERGRARLRAQGRRRYRVDGGCSSRRGRRQLSQSAARRGRGPRPAPPRGGRAPPPPPPPPPPGPPTGSPKKSSGSCAWSRPDNTNTEIAEKLQMSMRTVETHRAQHPAEAAYRGPPPDQDMPATAPPASRCSRARRTRFGCAAVGTARRATRKGDRMIPTERPADQAPSAAGAQSELRTGAC
jgi:hypothetical protein